MLKTFVEVAATGSFAAASERLFVTQSAVSLRVQRLEDHLGQPLFDRTRSGVLLTPAGRAFETHALALLQGWEDARRQIGASVPMAPGLRVGVEPPLWWVGGASWLDRLRAALPDVALHVATASPADLGRALSEGRMELGVSTAPITQPGVLLRRLPDEHLALWAGAAAREDWRRYYVLIDWGDEFLRFHGEHLPEVVPALRLGAGLDASAYVVDRGLAAYLPAGAAPGQKVLDAPVFARERWLVWRRDIDPLYLSVAEMTLSGEAENSSDAVGSGPAPHKDVAYIQHRSLTKV